MYLNEKESDSEKHAGRESIFALTSNKIILLIYIGGQFYNYCI